MLAPRGVLEGGLLKREYGSSLEVEHYLADGVPFYGCWGSLWQNLLLF